MDKMATYVPPKAQQDAWIAAPARKRTGQNRLNALAGWLSHWHHTYEDIPDWMRDNDLIRLHYRPHMDWQQAALSLFAWHNETVNIWSHLLGAVLKVVLFVWMWLHPEPLLLRPDGTPCSNQPLVSQPRWPVLVFMVCSMYTFSVSATAHLFHVVSKEANLLLWRLDHVGIAVSCAGAFVPVGAYVFGCASQRTLSLGYMSTTCALALVVGCCSMSEIFHTPPYRPYRLAVQCSFALWYTVPMAHALMHVGQDWEAQAALAWVCASGAVLVLGGVLFALRITEKLLPHRFDIIGSSHNIMHLMVVLGNICMFLGAYKLWLWRCGAGSCDPVACDTVHLNASSTGVLTVQ